MYKQGRGKESTQEWLVVFLEFDDTQRPNKKLTLLMYGWWDYGDFYFLIYIFQHCVYFLLCYGETFGSLPLQACGISYPVHCSQLKGVAIPKVTLFPWGHPTTNDWLMEWSQQLDLASFWDTCKAMSAPQKPVRSRLLVQLHDGPTTPCLTSFPHLWTNDIFESTSQ